MSKVIAKQILDVCRYGVLIGMFLALSMVRAQSPTDPADPSTPVPPTVYRSVFEDADASGRKEAARSMLPWKKLFKDDGSFVSEEELMSGVTSGGSMSTTNSDGMPSSRPRAMSSIGAGGSDARGMVKGVDRTLGNIKLKHGPIDKLGMPGMTMMFRVEDPSLLHAVREGQEVGFTIEQRGSAFVVTGFQP